MSDMELTSSPEAKEATMFRYTFRVDTPFGFSICDVTAASIDEAKAELRNRGLGTIVSIQTLGSFDLAPQVFLAW